MVDIKSASFGKLAIRAIAYWHSMAVGTPETPGAGAAYTLPVREILSSTKLMVPDPAAMVRKRIFTRYNKKQPAFEYIPAGKAFVCISAPQPRLRMLISAGNSAS
jgi:hypothetical protein